MKKYREFWESGKNSHAQIKTPRHLPTGIVQMASSEDYLALG